MTYRDVVAVPVGAVTEHFGQSYVYVMSDGQCKRRHVTTNRSTHSFVEITEGVEVGETVALDAYQRGLVDFADVEDDSNPAAPASPVSGA